MEQRSHLRNFKACIPSRADDIYTRINLVSINIITASIILLLTSSQGLYVLYSILSCITAWWTISWVRAKRSANVPEDIEGYIKSTFGHSVDGISFKLTDGFDFYVRDSFGFKTCFVPRRLALGAGEKLSQDSHEVIVILAHEIGHLATGDSKRFELSLILLASACFSAAWVLAALISVIDTSWMIFRAAVGFTTMIFVYLYLLYSAVKSREYAADSFAAYITESQKVIEFLQRLAHQEKYIEISPLYRLTHPTFSERLAIQKNFFLAYKYPTSDAIISGFIIGMLNVILPLVMGGAYFRFGDIPYWALLVVANYYICRCLLSIIATSVVFDQLSLLKIFQRCAEIYGAMGATTLLAMFVFLDETPVDIYNKLDTGGIDPLSNVLQGQKSWLRFLGPLIFFVAFHIYVYFGIRYMNFYRGLKMISPRFISVGTVLVIIASLGIDIMVAALTIPDNMVAGIVGGGLVVILPSIWWIVLVKRMISHSEGSGHKESYRFLPNEWRLWDRVHTKI
jgi:hypothetical protein